MFRKAVTQIRCFREFAYIHRKTATFIGSSIGVSVFIRDVLKSQKPDDEDDIFTIGLDVDPKTLKTINKKIRQVEKAIESYDHHLFLASGLGYALVYGIYGRFWYFSLPIMFVWKVLN